MTNSGMRRQGRLVLGGHPNEEINHRGPGRADRSEVSEKSVASVCNTMRQCFGHKPPGPLGYLVSSALFVLL